ncbi:FGGY-family carbohydrate kinase [Cryobacterium sp. M23]|uniref:FGGY-family carbohydrate kinase n=1 Tax=Cryobacterium sp. M23 TaxID=2048292 RepID=UPI003519E7E0
MRIDPNRAAEGLSIADQRIIEIAKAISQGATVLVMDEQTAALSDIEVERLFQVARNLRAQSAGILFISHRFDEVFALCDRITVMREVAPVGDTVLSVKGLGRAGLFADVTFAVDDPRFLAPGDMPARIRSYCAEHGLPVPGTLVELVRSNVESLAAAYAETLRVASELSGRSIRAVHIVGGGSQNDLLCQLTANRTGLTVLAGPVEATAIGNVLVQARAQGLVTGSLDSLRALVAQASAPRRYRPTA